MTIALPINTDSLLRRRTIESERGRTNGNQGRILDRKPYKITL